MAFDDLLQSDYDAIASGAFGETAFYRSLSGKPDTLVDWKEIDIVVDRNPDRLGIVSDRGPSPVVVFATKSQIASVAEQIDKIRIGNRIFRVDRILHEDDGGWELFCA